MQNYIVKDVIRYRNVKLNSCFEMPYVELSYYDFTFILEGTMVYYADGVKIELHKNDAVFLKPGTMRARDFGDAPVRYVSFNFYAFEDVDLPFAPFMPQCITENIRKLVSLYPPAELTTFFYAKEKCITMLNYIIFELLTASASKSKNEHVMKMMTHIEEHITENLTLTSVSTYANLSKEYTSYLFKRETGKTLTAYINERKMLLAKDLILNDKMSLQATAAYLGYENYNYFSKLFKKYMETTPVTLTKNR